MEQRRRQAAKSVHDSNKKREEKKCASGFFCSLIDSISSISALCGDRESRTRLVRARVAASHSHRIASALAEVEAIMDAPRDMASSKK